VLDEIIAEAGSANLASANEAALRLVVVDRILSDVLGWSRAEFHPEEYAGMTARGPVARRLLSLEGG
jgi:hypothetical protein